MRENRDWYKAITEQAGEIPVFNEMLTMSAAERARGKFDEVFSRQLATQQREMQAISADIDEQQKRLARDCKNEVESKYDIDALCTQDILRERIKAIEKNYIDLKCNFMNYLSTLL